MPWFCTEQCWHLNSGESFTIHLSWYALFAPEQIHKVQTNYNEYLTTSNFWIRRIPAIACWFDEHIVIRVSIDLFLTMCFLLFLKRSMGCQLINAFSTLSVFAAVYLRQLTALFIKLPFSILPSVGMTSETVPPTGPIHGFRDFQELYQAKSWNSCELWGRQLCELCCESSFDHFQLERCYISFVVIGKSILCGQPTVNLWEWYKGCTDFHLHLLSRPYSACSIPPINRK